MAIKEIKREWSPEQLDYVKHYLLHTEADVKDLPKCCIGSRATVGETDHEYVCAESGWVREEFKELATICPEILTDPDVKIYYDPAKTEIADSEFFMNADIEAAYFPNVQSIGWRSFGKCNNLVSAIFPKLNSVGQMAFDTCKLLEYVYAPQVETIATNGFNCCYKLKKAVFPLVKSITYGAFISNWALEVADFASATSIDQFAFQECKALTTLILRSQTLCTTADARYVFRFTPIASGTGYIYVPAALIEDYKVAANWSTYAAQFRAIEDYPEICDPTMDEPITKGEAIALVNEKMAGASGSGNAVQYIITHDEVAGTVSANMTFDELKAAWQAGKCVMPVLQLYANGNGGKLGDDIGVGVGTGTVYLMDGMENNLLPNGDIDDLSYLTFLFVLYNSNGEAKQCQYYLDSSDNLEF